MPVVKRIVFCDNGGNGHDKSPELFYLSVSGAYYFHVSGVALSVSRYGRDVNCNEI